MLFFDREDEFRDLSRTREIAERGPSQMAVLTGRRRIGKTKLALVAFQDSKVIYWFVSRSNQTALAKEFALKAAQALNVFFPNSIKTIPEIFELVMQVGKAQHFTLIIDECQEFFNIDPSIFSKLQDVWDRYKDESHVNLIMIGSVYTMMKRIFQDVKKPLYGRASWIRKLQPFKTSVLKTILSTYKPDYSNDDLLALYTFTGGVARYVELFMDNGCTDRKSMIELMTESGSVFSTEGNTLLNMEFGKDCGTYLSILGAIALGKNSVAEIASVLGEYNIRGQLKRLEEDYELIEKQRPIFSTPNSQTVRYAIKDQFLKFWFRYFYRYRDLFEVDDTESIAQYIESDYTTFSGLTLESWFREKLRETKQYLYVGSWWQRRKGVDQNEIDIVAISKDKKRAYIVEVKRQRKSFDQKKFLDKVDCIKHAALSNYEFDPAPCCLTLEDM